MHADNSDTVVILSLAAIHGRFIKAIETVLFAEVSLTLARSLIEYIETDQGFIVAVIITQQFALLTINNTQEDEVEQK